MPDLAVHSLSRRFGSVQALRDLSLTVKEGEIYGFVGSNGAGKTTAMRIILGVLSADSGHVTFGDGPMDRVKRARVGYMPEERGLYPKMKVGPQLAYLAELHGMKRAEATEAMEHWTEVLGVSSRRNDDVQKLSLGNQQRVQLAAALVHSPNLLVLDEPFSGLDPVAVDVMSNVLREQADAGVPVIFSSHQLDLVERLCDRVGIVKAGAMVTEGTIDELRVTPRRRIRVVVDSPTTPNWVDSVPRVTVVGSANGSAHLTDGAILVECDNGDIEAEQALLRAASSAGHLREFTPVRPHLADLFRDVVTKEEEEK